MICWPSERFESLVGELRGTPLFESEVDPELAQEVQREAIGGPSTLGDAQRGLDGETTERIISMARGMALTADPLEEAHQEYLAGLDGEVRAMSWTTTVGGTSRSSSLVAR